MGMSYRFACDPADAEMVLRWFRRLQEPPREVIAAQCVVLYFASLGPLHHAGDGTVDADLSPIVTVVPPRSVRESLWTIGEVHFRTSALSRRYPRLYRISKDFEEWLNSYECIYSLKDRDSKYSYYLEGSARNHDSSIFALPTGLEALQNERYFVGAQDNDVLIDTICRKLRLRGVQCAPPQERKPGP